MSPLPVQTAPEPHATGTYYRILDVAEALFAQNGIHGTSIRTITDLAGVNVAAVNYHFGSKEQLVNEIIRRRAQKLEQERSDMLDEIEERCRREGSAPKPEELVSVLVGPTFKRFRTGEPGWVNFIRFHARLVWEPETKRFLGQVAALGIFERIDELLLKALPKLSTDAALRSWRFQFVRAAVQQSAIVLAMLESGEEPVALAHAGALKDLSIDRIERELIAFVTAGLTR
jgi:AcrR family transcriptional regulator